MNYIFWNSENVRQWCFLGFFGGGVCFEDRIGKTQELILLLIIFFFFKVITVSNVRLILMTPSSRITGSSNRVSQVLLLSLSICGLKVRVSEPARNGM